MTRPQEGVPVVVTPAAAPVGTPPGVTRFDLLCHPDVVESAVALMRRWAEDRALTDVDRVRLTSLTRAVMDHGMRFDPRGVTLLVRWLDPDRVRLDVRWVGCASTSLPSKSSRDVQATISVLDAVAEEWGVGHCGPGWLHWMVVATG